MKKDINRYNLKTRRGNIYGAINNKSTYNSVIQARKEWAIDSHANIVERRVGRRGRVEWKENGGEEGC